MPFFHGLSKNAPFPHQGGIPEESGLAVILSCSFPNEFQMADTLPISGVSGRQAGVQSSGLEKHRIEVT